MLMQEEKHPKSNMKKTQTIKATAMAVVTIMAGVTVGAAAESIEVSEKAAAVGMLPYQKRGDVLENDERNPFAERTIVKDSNVSTTDGSTEESKLRGILSNMRVTGISKGEKGFRAMVGGLIMEEGETIPPLIGRQSDKLRVSKVTKTTVEITWINEEGAEEPRKHVLSLDLRPLVRSKLPSSGVIEPIDPRGGVNGTLTGAEMLANGGAAVSPAD